MLKAIISSASERFISSSRLLSSGGKSTKALTISLGQKPYFSSFGTTLVAKLVVLFSINYKEGSTLVQSLSGYFVSQKQSPISTI